MKYPRQREDISLEDLDNICSERFLIIFLEKKYILIDSDNFICLLDNLNKGNSNFNANHYFHNNSVTLDIDSDMNTDNFIIFDDNQHGNSNNFYHFFYINYPKNLNKDLMYLSEINSKSNFNS